jgi:riboflavin synthase
MDDGLIRGLKIGASVSIDGVCMTVVRVDEHDVYFDAMKETLDKTTLGRLDVGDKVNIERSVRVGDEIGGHYVSGHVHGKAKISNINKAIEDNIIISFLIPSELTKFIFDKGFVSLNGASLTIVDVDRQKNSIRVSFIPETLRKTTFGDKVVGSEINIEIEQQTQSIVETVERYLSEYKV